MGTLVIGAPLLAGGPPGWVAYAGLAVGTVAVSAIAASELSYYMSQPRASERSRASGRSTTRTGDCIPCRQWRVVAHAQGTDCGGTTRSTIGAAPVILTVPVPAAAGAACAQATYAMLNRTQQRIRTEAFARALRWLSERPANGGYLGQKSFEVAGVRGGIRFDIDSYGPSNNFVT